MCARSDISSANTWGFQVKSVLSKKNSFSDVLIETISKMLNIISVKMRESISNSR